MINEYNLKEGTIRIDGGIYKLGEISKILGSTYIDILCPVCGEEVAKFFFKDGRIFEGSDIYYWDNMLLNHTSINNHYEDEEPPCPHLHTIEEEGKKWMERKEEEERKSAEEKAEAEKPVNPDMSALFADINLEEDD